MVGGFKTILRHIQNNGNNDIDLNKKGAKYHQFLALKTNLSVMKRWQKVTYLGRFSAVEILEYYLDF